MSANTPHNFHIPVMGIAFTIDSPIKVACYGINSTLSIIEDNLIEKMREYFYRQNNEPYTPIGIGEANYRTRRITDYLNLVNRTIQRKMDGLRSSAFRAGSDIVKYFEMLPELSGLKAKYNQFLEAKDETKAELENWLRQHMVPGAVEVNIMTKVDKVNKDQQGTIIADGSDALSALKAYAESDLENSAVVFSAGMNPRLFNYMEHFREFDASSYGVFKKKVIVKVSDYRSALIQGKYLAKKGIWVSEFRIESGLNCGGHAFATPGLLLGPILEEFHQKKAELSTELFYLYSRAMEEKNLHSFPAPHPLQITVQGGIGTHEEQDLLLNHYGVSRTGWGTPFLLCPEATTVDEHTLQLLCKSKREDIMLSKASPLGVPFHYLKGTTAEQERLGRIARNKPGSPCTEKFLVSNTEFTEEPICTASIKYQRLKLAQLQSAELSEQAREQQIADLQSKECICIGLSNAASINYEVPMVKKLEAVTICPGPNIVNFSKVATLREMCDHIYGRQLLPVDTKRAHMFVKELQLYITYIQEEIRTTLYPGAKEAKNWKTYLSNLLLGIEHYKDLLKQNLISQKQAFSDGLQAAAENIMQIQSKVAILAV